MTLILLIAVTLIIAFFLSKFLFKGHQAKNLPGGSLGYPLLGESLSFRQAQKQNRGPQWFEERVSKHGPVFKTSLMGSPTVVVTGQAGNKFVLGARDDVLATKQPPTLATIAGRENIFELTGSRYKLVKGAMMSFLKPENLQNIVKHMDELIKTILLRETENKDTIKGVATMKKLTFEIASSILFGIKNEHTTEALSDDFSLAFKAIPTLPFNIPGTVYWRGLRARSRIVNRILPILKERREELSKGKLSPTSDVFTCLLTLRDENQHPISDDMIIDNYFTLIIASHDTSAILLSLMIWKLSRDSEIYNKVLEEQMDILRKREEGIDDGLTWAEIHKMKYTWRVAQELMRIIPPVFGSFRTAVKDTQYEGYDIPKGWQVFWMAHGTHMDKDIFDKPTEFDPSRFENPSKPIPPYTYLPFGGGLHTCIGNEFAKIELLITIHNLVTRFEWSQVHPEEAITRKPMPYPSMGLPIKIKPRKL
ncbi:unnamed protein product [Prunus armeniaca]|uniref:Cytochrome P450 n=2 Tax=Prunus TaxID=3754 RepID=A0A6J5UZC6_PRUAR|nr:PREDICTED: taxadiene 5-alpha hydroxylase-like [Prunus mume]KAH0997670.1 hypothetical protein GBA52_021534 [Prunus armeniaca]CAB4282039.1 unnamed protein product [Prunus armeniaca]